MRSFLKALSILILGLFLTLGIKALPVQAAETWEAPEWTDYKTAEFRWKIPSDVNNYDAIQILIYEDGTEHWGLGNVVLCLKPNSPYGMMESNIKDGYLYARYPLAFDSTGTYTLRAVAKEVNENGDVTENDAGTYSPMSEGYEYTLPSVSLPAPSNLRWVDHTGDRNYFVNGSFAYATCDLDENAALYVFLWYKDGVSQHSVYNSWTPGFGWGEVINESNYSYVIRNLDLHEYSFKVRAIPADITQYAPSEYSDLAPKYVVSNKVTENTLALSSISNEVNESNVNEKVEEIKDMESLDTVLRTNSEALGNLKTVEDKYRQVNSITENAPVSSVEGISSSGIEVTGATINVAPGATLGLNIGTPDSYPSIDRKVYKNTLVFDMGIQASDGTDFSQNLDIPVTIKLPIAPGFDTEHLKILHFRADGSSEEIPFARMEAGYIYISIYHFSTFAFAQEATAEDPVPVRMHRLYNPNSGEHFYTGSDSERDNLVNAGWNYEGPGWDAPANLGAPVYRFYNRTLGDHHYTMDASEVEYLNNNGWEYEGVAWNSAPEDTGKPLYRLYNPNAYENGESGAHHYTLSETERDNLAAAGWNYEGVAWFSL